MASSLYTNFPGAVIPAGKRVSVPWPVLSEVVGDGELKYVHVAWIPAIPAGMTGFETLVYNG